MNTKIEEKNKETKEKKETNKNRETKKMKKKFKDCCYSFQQKLVSSWGSLKINIHLLWFISEYMIISMFPNKPESHELDEFYTTL